MSNATNSRNAYVPDGAAWGRVTPTDAGLDAAKVQTAVAFAEASDSPWPRSFYYPDGRYVGIVEWNESKRLVTTAADVPCGWRGGG